MSHEGNDEVKEGKMDLLQRDLEAFVMKRMKPFNKCMIGSLF